MKQEVGTSLHIYWSLLIKPILSKVPLHKSKITNISFHRVSTLVSQLFRFYVLWQRLHETTFDSIHFDIANTTLCRQLHGSNCQVTSCNKQKCQAQSKSWQIRVYIFKWGFILIRNDTLNIQILSLAYVWLVLFKVRNCDLKLQWRWLYL